eukprot:TRINITY_DN9901_c0_g1_i2.p1 TRINITY_DN9901_c0_g1~~TRINITY_DN9901_c0_g1_i2.p1  ORF type:complete len:1349 (+),score=277.31 TRINITY_DN9901_c0_g1_i2:49-4095(+)
MELQLKSLSLYVSAPLLEVLPQISGPTKSPKPPPALKPTNPSPRSISAVLTEEKPQFSTGFLPKIANSQHGHGESSKRKGIIMKRCTVTRDFVNHPFHKRPCAKKRARVRKKHPSNIESLDEEYERAFATYPDYIVEHEVRLPKILSSKESDWETDNEIDTNLASSVLSPSRSSSSMQSFRSALRLTERTNHTEASKALSVLSEDPNLQSSAVYEQKSSPRLTPRAITRDLTINTGTSASTITLDVPRKNSVQKSAESNLTQHNNAVLNQCKKPVKPRKPYKYPLVFDNTVQDDTQFDLDEYFPALKHGRQLQQQPNQQGMDGAAKVPKAKSYKLLSLPQIQMMESKFREVHSHGNINREQFIDIISRDVEDSEETLVELFRKIDDSGQQIVSYEQFVSFIMQEWICAEDASLTNFNITPSATLLDPKHGHHHMIARLRIFEDISLYATCGRDGVVTLWDSNQNRKVQSLLPFEDSAQAEKHICYKTAAAYLPSPRRAQIFFQHRLAAQPMAKSSQISMVEQPLSRIYAQLTKCTPWPTDIAYSQSLDQLIVATLDQSFTIYSKKRDHGYQSVRSIPVKTTPLCIAMMETSISGGHRDFVISGSPKGELAWYDHREWNTVEKIHPHTDSISDIRYFANLGLLSSSLDSTISIIDVERPSQALYLKGHSGGVQSFDYSPLYKMVFSGGTSNDLIAWDPIRRNPIIRLWGHYAPITTAICNDANHQLISCSVDKTIKIWDVRRMQCIRTLIDMAHYKPENALTVSGFDSKNQKLVTGGNMLRVWTFQDTQPENIGVSGESVVRQHTAIIGLFYSNSFKQIISVSVTGLVRVWNVATGQLSVQFKIVELPLYVVCTVLDARQRRLVTCTSDAEIKFWNFNSGSSVFSITAPKKRPLSHVCFIQPNVQRPIVGVYESKKIGTWPDFQIDPYVSHRQYQSVDVDITAVCVCSTTVVVGFLDGSVRFWDCDSKIFKKEVRLAAEGEEIVDDSFLDDEDVLENPSEVKKMVFLKGRNLVVVATADSFLHILSSSEARILKYRAVRIPDKVMALGSCMLDDDRSTIEQMDKDSSSERNMPSYGDDCLFATGDSKGRIKVWDAIKMTRMDIQHVPVCDWQAHKISVSNIVALSGGHIASSGTDGKVNMWSLNGHFVRSMKDMNLVMDFEEEVELQQTRDVKGTEVLNATFEDARLGGDYEKDFTQTQAAEITTDWAPDRGEIMMTVVGDSNPPEVKHVQILDDKATDKESFDKEDTGKNPESFRRSYHRRDSDEHVKSPVPDTRYEGFVVPLVVQYSDLKELRARQIHEENTRSATEVVRLSHPHMMALVADQTEEDESSNYASHKGHAKKSSKQKS